MGKRNRPSAATVTPTPVTHGLLRSWTGGIGECGVECECGLIFDGFESVIAARNARWDHYLDSIEHPVWCDRSWCGEGGGDLHGTPERRIEMGNDDSISAWLHERHGDAEDRGIMVSVDCFGGVAGLTIDQAIQLRDNLEQLLAAALDGDVPVSPLAQKDIAEAFRVGREVGHGQATGEWAVVDSKPAEPERVNRRRAPKTTDCKLPAQRAQVSMRVPAAASDR
jgi:hypothetical protein